MKSLYMIQMIQGLSQTLTSINTSLNVCSTFSGKLKCMRAYLYPNLYKVSTTIPSEFSDLSQVRFIAWLVVEFVSWDDDIPNI